MKEFLEVFGLNLQSMNGIDIVSAAEFVAEIGDISRFPSAKHLASYAGVAPLANSSGQHENLRADWRGNRVLNCLFYKLAIRVIMPTGKNKVYVNPLFREYYENWCSVGENENPDSHINRKALKRVERRLVNVIYSMMKNKRDYINPPVLRTIER